MSQTKGHGGRSTRRLAARNRLRKRQLVHSPAASDAELAGASNQFGFGPAHVDAARGRLGVFARGPAVLGRLGIGRTRSLLAFPVVVALFEGVLYGGPGCRVRAAFVFVLFLGGREGLRVGALRLRR